MGRDSELVARWDCEVSFDIEFVYDESKVERSMPLLM